MVDARVQQVQIGLHEVHERSACYCRLQRTHGARAAIMPHPRCSAAEQAVDEGTPSLDVKRRALHSGDISQKRA